MIDEAIDRLEVLETDVKNQLATAKSSYFAGNVNAVKNHITVLFDLALESSKSSISTAVQSMATIINDAVVTCASHMLFTFLSIIHFQQTTPVESC